MLIRLTSRARHAPPARRRGSRQPIDIGPRGALAADVEREVVPKAGAVVHRAHGARERRASGEREAAKLAYLARPALLWRLRLRAPVSQDPLDDRSLEDGRGDRQLADKPPAMTDSLWPSRARRGRPVSGRTV